MYREVKETYFRQTFLYSFSHRGVTMITIYACVHMRVHTHTLKKDWWLFLRHITSQFQNQSWSILPALWFFLTPVLMSGTKEGGQRSSLSDH